MKSFSRGLGISLFLVMLVVIPVFSKISLPKLISDGMVLQRGIKANVWGWGDVNEKVTIRFNKKIYHTTTDASGKWMIALPPSKAGGPFVMDIEGKNKIVVKDIYIGDVWFCSGQSNMVLTMERVKEKYPEEIADANYPQIRNFFIPTASDVFGPHPDLPPGKWTPLSAESVKTFGAVACFFAKAIYRKYHVPIGIINSSVGGTPIEAWVSENGFEKFPQYQALIKNFKDTSFVNRISKPVVSEAPLPNMDKGTTGPLPWYDPAFIPQGWHKFWLPGYWEDQGVKGLNGIIWFRKQIDVPANMAGKPAKLFLGRIIDADQTYVNGVLAGSVTYQYPPRRYELPDGCLKPGKNIIMVRVTSNFGKGGFVPDKPYYLSVGKERIDLRGDWDYQVGQVFQPRENTSAPVPIFSAQNSPTGLFNTMVAPATPYTIKGFAWYQGESNAGRPAEYEGLLTSLIRDWRSQWKQGELPFIYVQLPDFMEVQYSPSESQWAELRNGQRKALTESNTAMVVTLGLGEWNDIHPLSKKEIGERIALAAENLAYNEKDVVFSGPLYKSHEIKGNKIVISFSHTGTGLMAKGNNTLYYFAIAGADKKYVWANAEIDGEKVIVWSERISDPVSVRYAWANNPEGANLFNKEGLPASPFETDPDR